MDKNRIYGQKFDINTENIREFYDKRAKQLPSMDCAYTAVLLGDQDPEYAKKWDLVEKEEILPQLNIDNDTDVIDIGCGIGRWAEVIIPNCASYIGVDFSKEMIKSARNRNKFEKLNYKFYANSFQELVCEDSTPLDPLIKFDCMLIGGVCMYINDEDLFFCFSKITNLLKEKCIIYLEETVSNVSRLTLSQFPSEALKTNYDVIYRTTEEYNTLYKKFFDNGFQITEQNFLPHLNRGEKYNETERWYTLLERSVLS